MKIGKRQIDRNNTNIYIYSQKEKNICRQKKDSIERKYMNRQERDGQLEIRQIDKKKYFYIEQRFEGRTINIDRKDHLFENKLDAKIYIVNQIGIAFQR